MIRLSGGWVSIGGLCIGGLLLAAQGAEAQDATAVLSNFSYQSNQGVATSGAVVVESGYCVAYSAAGTQVDLKPGFHAKQGSVFHAVIAPVLGVPAVLPAGTAGAGYVQQLAASGGRPGYTFSGSGLPAGLTLSAAGMVSWTPAAAGTFTFNVQVTDSVCQTVTVSASLIVNATGGSGSGERSA